MKVEQIERLLAEALDGIELLDNAGRERLMRWAEDRRNSGAWGAPGEEILIGIHNKCVQEGLTEDPTWSKEG